MVAIIDYGAGNLMSISKAVQWLAGACCVTSDPGAAGSADAIILPGVGAFGPAARMMRENGLAQSIGAAARQNRPVLGICLGMQLLFETSEESPGVPGLGLIEGRVIRFPEGGRVPHLGWNTVEPFAGPLFDGAGGEAPGCETRFYFAHSYLAVPSDPCVITSYTEHIVRFPSSVRDGSLFGVQFHPEKSGSAGLRLLRKFLEFAGEEVSGCSSYPLLTYSEGSA
ncbi:MAG: imidazole glycerol phosphate synthase subunit HisH [Ignavibacteriales bacterium]